MSGLNNIFGFNASCLFPSSSLCQYQEVHIKEVIDCDAMVTSGMNKKNLFFQEILLLYG